MKEKHSEVLLRVNTNGLGELFNKKPIAEEMAKYIDAVSISLNAPTAERYQEVTQPCFENAFPDMLAFAEKSKKLFFCPVQCGQHHFTGRNRCVPETRRRDGDSVESSNLFVSSFFSTIINSVDGCHTLCCAGRRSKRNRTNSIMQTIPMSL